MVFESIGEAHQGEYVVNIEEISVTKKHKKRENNARDRRVKELQAELRQLNRRLEKEREKASGPLKINMSEEDFNRRKDVLQMKIFDAQEEIEHLDDQKMTDQKFWGLKGALADEDAMNSFDYGREILRASDYDRVLEKKSLPYEVFPLFLRTEWYSYAPSDQQ